MKVLLELRTVSLEAFGEHLVLIPCIGGDFRSKDTGDREPAQLRLSFKSPESQSTILFIAGVFFFNIKKAHDFLLILDQVSPLVLLFFNTESQILLLLLTRDFIQQGIWNGYT